MGNKIKVGELIGVNAATNDHGCRDYAVLRYTGNGKAVVVEVQNCSSCWQVGHDNNHVFASIGDTWKIKNVKAAGKNWTTDVKWEVET